MSGLAGWIDRFASQRVMVLGDAMLDCYLEGTTRRLCPEAPVPVVNLASRTDVPGGAANTAVNVRALGATPIFLSVIGDDSEGRLLCQSLKDRGVSTAGLIESSNRRTLAKHRVLAGSQLLVRFDQGSTAVLDRHTERRLIAAIERHYADCDAVIISDYSYGVMSPRVLACLERLRNAAVSSADPKILVIDAKSFGHYRHLHATAVKPNFNEVKQLLDRPEIPLAQRAETIMAEGDRILDSTGAKIAAVTLDSDGAVLLEVGRAPFRTYAQPRRHAQCAGAGDTFLATLTLALAAGADSPAAAEMASAAAAVVVGKEGTAACTADELAGEVFVPGKAVADLRQLAAQVAGYRRQGKRIVLTGGCFDILHRGHVTYLNRAKTLGDVLIVGVNSDDSIRRLKGPERPINTAEDRVEVLAALSCIDHIIVFAENDPTRLIEAVRPDVFVKGGDYTRASLPEAALVERLGGRVEFLPLVADRSTSRLIRHIRAIQPIAESSGNGGVHHEPRSLVDGQQYIVH